MARERRGRGRGLGTGDSIGLCQALLWFDAEKPECRLYYESSKLSTVGTWGSALDGDTALVGTHHRPIGAPGTSTRYPARVADVITVFNRGSDGWTEVTTIRPDVDNEPRTWTSTPVPSAGTDGGSSHPEAGGENFGNAFALDGDTILIGSEEAELIYEFERTSSGWVQQGSFVTTDTGAKRGNYSISLENKTALAGMYAVEHPRRWGDSGTAYVFERERDGWSKTDTLAIDSSDFDSFAFDGDRAMIGISKGKPGEKTGQVAVFEQTENGWTETTRLTPGDGDVAHFGSIALAGDTALISSGRTTAPSGTKYGASVFERTNDGWSRTTTLVPANTDQDEERVGFYVALADDGDTAVVGGENEGKTYEGFGDAFVFTRESDGWTETTSLDPPIDDSEIRGPLRINDSGDAVLLELDEGAFVFDL